jgi:hypothetical protein
MMRAWPILFVVALVWGCANNEKSSTQPMGDGKSSSSAKNAPKGEFDKSGFVTSVDKKYKHWLWVFKDGSKELEEFRKTGDPGAKSVTQPGVGPKGMTLRAPDSETISAYLAAK